MKKSSLLVIVLFVVGGLLAMIGSVTKNAYTTGYSYIVTASEEREIISKASTCMFIGIVLLIIAFGVYLKNIIKKD